MKKPKVIKKCTECGEPIGDESMYGLEEVMDLPVSFQKSMKNESDVCWCCMMVEQEMSHE